MTNYIPSIDSLFSKFTIPPYQRKGQQDFYACFEARGGHQYLLTASMDMDKPIVQRYQELRRLYPSDSDTRYEGTKVPICALDGFRFLYEYQVADHFRNRHQGFLEARIRIERRNEWYHQYETEEQVTNKACLEFHNAPANQVAVSVLLLCGFFLIS